MPDVLAEWAELQACWCWVCHDKLGSQVNFMVLCPLCGCKRCPHATNHVHACTQSNESGQVGSTYGTPCLEGCCDEYNAAVEEAKRRYGMVTDG